MDSAGLLAQGIAFSWACAPGRELLIPLRPAEMDSDVYGACRRMKEMPHLLQQKAVICGFAPNEGGGEGGICRRMKEMPHLLQQMAAFCGIATNGGGGEGSICRRMKETPHLLQQMAAFCGFAPNEGGMPLHL